MTYDRENFLKMARENSQMSGTSRWVQTRWNMQQEKHAGVVRLSGEPYIIHQLCRHAFVEWGMDRDTVIRANSTT